MTCHETHHFCCHAIALTWQSAALGVWLLLVASPGLLDLVANSVDEMRLANLFCWAADFASGSKSEFLWKSEHRLDKQRPKRLNR